MNIKRYKKVFILCAYSTMDDCIPEYWDFASSYVDEVFNILKGQDNGLD